jgi:hypothetical protein
VLLFEVEQYPANPPSERICGISTHFQVRRSPAGGGISSAIKQNPAKRSAPFPLSPLRPSVNSHDGSAQLLHEVVTAWFCLACA